MVDTAEVSIALALATALGLAFMVVVTSDVSEKVHGPSEKLLQDHAGGSRYRRLLHELGDFMNGLAHMSGELCTSLGHEDHVPTQVSGSFVVLAVRNLPREVRH